MRRRFSHTRQAGFALLEMLLSMSLLAIIITFITGGFSFGFRAWEKDLQLEKLRDADLVDHSIVGWIAGAMAVSQGQGQDASELAFRGTPNRLDFVTLSDGRTQRAGLVTVSLRTEEQGLERGQAAVAESAIFRRGTKSVSMPSSLLAENASFEFSYFGSSAVGGMPSWHREWTHMATLPTLVAFRIVRHDFPRSTATIVRVRSGNVLSDGPRL